MEKILFYEEQKFSQRRMAIIFLISFFSVISLFANGIYTQEVLNKPFGDNPTSTQNLIVIGIVATVLIIAVNLLLMKMNLKVRITEEAFWISFPPLINKWEKITPDQIERYEIRKFNAKREFGGHGIKRRLRAGTAYTVSGNTGLQLYFINGKKLLVGTQKKQALEYALKKLMIGESEGTE